MQISANIAFPPGVNPGPMPTGVAFRTHLVKAFDLTNAAITSLSQGPGVINVISPGLVGTLSAKQAVAELNMALQQDAPDAARTAAQNAQQLLTLGVNELTHRLNGPVPIEHVLDNFGAAKASMQTALDVLGAAQSHIQLPSPDSAIQ